MKFLTLLIIGGVLITAACEDPAANKPKATTTPVTANGGANSSANSAALVASTNAAAESPDILAGMKPVGTALEISSENSKIEFVGSKVTGKHDGGFKSFKGLIDLVSDRAEISRVAVEIEMASVYSDADGLTKHLQTGDFFEVEKYPKASFVSTKIEPDAGNGASSYMVTGELTLRGVKKSITFPATIAVSASDVSVKSEFSINRKDFGILYAGKADDLIRDDVLLRLDLKAPRK